MNLRRFFLVGALLTIPLAWMGLGWAERSLEQIEIDLFRTKKSPEFVPEKDVPTAVSFDLEHWRNGYMNVVLVLHLKEPAPVPAVLVPLQYEVRQITHVSKPPALFVPGEPDPGFVTRYPARTLRMHWLGEVQGTDRIELEFTLREASLPSGVRSCQVVLQGSRARDSFEKGDIIEGIGLVRGLTQVACGLVILLALLVVFLAAFHVSIFPRKK